MESKESSQFTAYKARMVLIEYENNDLIEQSAVAYRKDRRFIIDCSLTCVLEQY
jgi:hypothetical protein